MKEKIIQLYTKFPKHYVRLIKKNYEILKWIDDNSKINSGTLKDKIYSAISGESNVCPLGKLKTVSRISKGFKNCGPAAICECTKRELSLSISKTKQNQSKEEKSKINKKRASTMLKKYGVEFNSQRPDIKHIWQVPKITKESFEKLNNYDWLNTEYNAKKRSLVDIADELNVYYSTVGEYCKKFNFEIRQTTSYSLCEKEVGDYIESLGFNCLRNDWSTINKELDIFIPSKNLAIEINGLYWHSYHKSSTKPENKFKHVEKTQLASDQNVQLLQFTDFEWINKTDIVKAIIKSKLGINKKIPARKCTVKEVPKTLEKEFINLYHIQGFVPSLKAVGLYFNDELMSIMSVGKTRYTNKADYELLRYCTKTDITIVGGGSKLLKELSKHFDSIISYCDLSRANGSSYKKIGFQEIGTTGPGYFWTDGNTVFSRYKCQKKQLKRWLASFDENLSESENMFNAGYRRFYDCGNKIFLFKIAQKPHK